MNTRLFNTKSLLLLTLFCLTLASGLNAQGFVRHYPFFTWSEGGAQSVFPQADGSFRLTATAYPDFGIDVGLLWMDADAQGHLTGGDTASVTLSDDPTHFLLENGDYLTGSSFDTGSVTVRYVAAAGDTVWSNAVAFPGFDQITIMALRPNTAGEVFVRGYLWNSANGVAVDSGFVFKLSAAGDLLWLTPHSFDLTFVLPRSLEPTPDGGCVMANYYWNGITNEAVLHFDAAGNLAWSYTPQNANLFPFNVDYSLAVNAAGEIVVPVQGISNPAGGVDSLFLDKLNASGQLLARTNLSVVQPSSPNFNAKLVFPTADGGWVVACEGYLLNSWTKHLFRLNAAGGIVWQKELAFITDAFPAEFADGQELSDGSLVVYGWQQQELFLIKIGADGAIYPHSLIGKVARDSTFDCVIGPADPPLQGWVVRAAGADGLHYFTTTGAGGQYAMSDLDAGAYWVKVVPPNYLWNPCADSVLVQFAGSTPQTDTADFPIQPLYDCPLMQVDIATGLLRRCLPGVYQVQYCNAGNQAASPAGLAVTLDPLIEIDSVSVPYAQNGNVLSFDLGAVAPGDCGNIQLYFTVSCDAELGQTLCVEAHVTPDTLCAPNIPGWSGAAIEVTAQCLNDSIRFTIRNTGSGPMMQDLDFIVVDDHVITRQGTFNLPAGGEHPESVPADGSTWRLTAEQEPGFPFGIQMPSIAIEGCNPAGGPFSMGMLNMFPNFSGDPFHDIACNTIVGSYDPNDKQAFPIGAEAQHFIDPNQPLEYLIRFQNTGTDTAFTVVIRDTLSSLLDPASVRPGAASHDYEWSLSGQGILTFVFDNILLPDSNVNEPGSHGFVQFKIDQQKDVPPGTLLENSAGIFFDFNAPIITNTVFHTIATDFLPLDAPERAALPGLSVWPNPAVRTTTVQADRPFRPGDVLLLRDVSGRLVSQMPLAATTVATLHQAGSPAGLYFVEWRDAGGRLLGVGKVVWQE